MDLRIFKISRFLLGFYLIFLWVRIWPWIGEIYMSSGLGSGLLSFLGNVEYLTYQLILLLGILSACTMAIGKYHNFAATICLIVYIFLREMNYALSISPENAFVCWSILLVAITSKDAFKSNGLNFKIMKMTWFFVVVFTAFQYTSFGIQKIFLIPSPVPMSMSTWNSGDALAYFLRYNHIRRSWYGDFFLSVPDFILAIGSYLGLLIEAAGILFVIQRKSRELWWYLVMGLQFQLLIFANITELNLGMLVCHMFLIEKEWVTYNYFSKKFENFQNMITESFQSFSVKKS